jgi:hypothetical protein
MYVLHERVRTERAGGRGENREMPAGGGPSVHRGRGRRRKGGGRRARRSAIACRTGALARLDAGRRLSRAVPAGHLPAAWLHVYYGRLSCIFPTTLHEQPRCRRGVYISFRIFDRVQRSLLSDSHDSHDTAMSELVLSTYALRHLERLFLAVDEIGSNKARPHDSEAVLNTSCYLDVPSWAAGMIVNTDPNTTTRHRFVVRAHIRLLACAVLSASSPCSPNRTSPTPLARS